MRQEAAKPMIGAVSYSPRLHPIMTATVEITKDNKEELQVQLDTGIIVTAQVEDICLSPTIK